MTVNQELTKRRLPNHRELSSKIFRGRVHGQDGYLDPTWDVGLSCNEQRCTDIYPNPPKESDVWTVKNQWVLVL